MTAGRTNHTLFAAAPAVMQALETKTSSVSNTPTITDDELLKVYINTYLQCAPNDAIRFARAVLALAEQKNAAKVAELEAAERQRNVFAQQANEYAEEARTLRARIAELEAQAAQPAQVAAPEQTSAVPPGAIYVTDTGHAWDAKGNPEMANDPNVEMFVPFVPVAAPTQADGWRWVPVEPTQEMAEAAKSTLNWLAYYLNQGGEAWPVKAEMYGAVYKTMLAAAPKREGGSDATR
jgi:hypothetical protein